MPRPTTQWGLLLMYGVGFFGSRWQTGLWLKPDSTLPGTFNIQTAATDLYGVYATAIVDLMNDQNEYIGARLYVGNGTYTASADVNSAYPGTKTNKPIPTDDYIIVRMQAAVAGRNGKGRFFISGLDSNMQDGGRVSSAGDTAMASVITALTTAQTGGGVSWNVQQYDHKNNVLHLPDFFSYNPVLGNKKKRSPIF